MKTSKDIVETIRDKVNEEKARSAWARGVLVYANELLDDLAEGMQGGYITADDIKSPQLLKKAMLNGADDWSAYSWGGCSLVYDGDIAERLCSPSELKKTKDGERRPNAREEWLDVQSRALCQAARRIAYTARGMSRND